MKPEETLQLTMAEINKKLDHITLLVEGKVKGAHESCDDYLSSTFVNILTKITLSMGKNEI